MPTGGFALESQAAFACKPVKFRLASGFGLFPIRSEQPAIFQTMQRRVKRALRYLHNIARNLLKPLRDGIAVNRAKSNDFENQKIESALRQIGAVTLHFYILDRIYVEVQVVSA